MKKEEIIQIGDETGDCYGAPPAPIVFYSGPGTFEVRFVRPQLSGASAVCSLFKARIENA
jgi:hypothetical protein